MTLPANVFLGERQFFTRRDAYLLLHDVNAGHILRDAVFHLKALVHLHEIKFVVDVHQKLDGSRIGVADRARALDCGVTHAMPQGRGQLVGGRLLNEFLVAQVLDAALALAQMHHMAVFVGQYLHFDVARLLDKLFHVHVGLAERRRGLCTGQVVLARQFLLVLDKANTPSAAAQRGLDEQGEADLLRPLQGFVHAVHGAGRAGNDRNARLHGDLGIVSLGDLVVVVSKSGNTEELVRLVPYARVRLPAKGLCTQRWLGDLLPRCTKLHDKLCRHR